MIKLNFHNREELLVTVERYTEIPMLILVVVMLVTLVIPLLVHLPESTVYFLELIDWIIWAAFALELAVKTYITPRKLVYLKQHWLDVVVVALPLLRIFRIFRVARLARGARITRSTRALRLLKFVRIFVVFGKISQEVRQIFSRHGFNYLLFVFLGLIGLSTLVSYNFDKNVAGGSGSIADHLWLTVLMAFTAGFADIFPQSPEAKAISVFLAVAGMVTISFFTASLASYFTEKGQDVEQERLEKKLDQLLDQVAQLRKSTKGVKSN